MGWTGAGAGTLAPGKGRGAGAGLGRDASLDGPPPGPPGRSSLPVVTGLAATCFGRGVGLETALAGSPWPVWIVPLLYKSSLATVESLTDLTVAILPGFLLYSTLDIVSLEVINCTGQGRHTGLLSSSSASRGEQC